MTTRSAKNGDDDDSICNVYKQVQEEDSEWYAKISHMLGNDEMEQLDTTFTCGDDEEDADTKSKPRVEVRQANGKVTNDQVGTDQVISDDQRSKENAELTLSKQAETSNESQPPAAIPPATIDSSIASHEHMVESSVTAPHSEGHYTQFLDEEQDEDLTDLEEKISINERSQTKVNSSDDQKNDSLQAQRGDDKEVEPSIKQQSCVVRIYNKFTKEYENIAPLAALEKLGYKEKELQLLRPQVLELIVDDRIPRPRRGIPKRWVKSVNDDQYVEEEESYDDDFGWQVQVVSRTKPTKKETPKSQTTEQRIDPLKDLADDAEYDRTDNEKVITQTTKRSRVSGNEEPPSRVNEDSTQTRNEDEDVGSDKQQQSRQRQSQSDQQQQSRFSGDEQDVRRPQRYGTDRRRRTRSARDDSYDDTRNSKQSRRERGSGRRQRTPRRQELLIDRNPYDDDPSGNKFWMDLPMFKDFLRKEAQFRLKILGPDWKESVLDESRWRYDLYKTWLQMIDEGVGENPLYTYTDSSRPRRRRSRTYDSDFNTRAAPRPRSEERSQAKARQRRYTTDDYREMEEGVDNVQRRRARRPQQRKSEQRSEWQSKSSQPSRREQWSNFSDLEESLMSSKREREDSRQDYQQNSYEDTRPRRRSSEAYEENEMSDAYFDTLEEDEQIQRPRKRMRRKEKSYEDFDNESYEYD